MASNNVKDLYETIGDCGRFHVVLTVCIHAATVVSVFGMMMMVFGRYNPGWKCVDNNVSAINSTEVFSYSSSTPTIIIKEDNLNSTQWSVNCDVKKECEHLTYNTDSSTMVTEWDLFCDSSWVPSIIISVQMTGALLGGYVSGQIGDRFGRKVSVYVNVAFNSLCHLVAAFSVSWQMYAAILFFVGFASQGIGVNTYPYPLEFVNAWWRGIIIAIPVWNLGLLLFGVIALALRSWTLMHILTAVMGVFAFLPIFWVPESLRWLAVSGKVTKAKKVVTKISRINSKPCPDTDVIDEIAREEKNRMGNHVYTVFDIFKNPVLRGYSLKFGFIWLTMSYTYYGISFGIKAFSGDFYINLLIFSLLEIPGLILVAAMVNRVGRRLTALLFFFLESLFCIALVTRSLMTSGSPDECSVLILASLCKMLVSAVWNIFNVFSSELYPTVVRSIHYGYLSSLSRLGAIVSPYLIPDDPEKLYISFIIIGIIGVISCVIVWTLPETNESIMMDTTRSTYSKYKKSPDDGEMG